MGVVSKFSTHAKFFRPYFYFQKVGRYGHQVPIKLVMDCACHMSNKCVTVLYISIISRFIEALIKTYICRGTSRCDLYYRLSTITSVCKYKHCTVLCLSCHCTQNHTMQ
ncbi:hypothetical protein XELAEV_18002837mg [Xenopus laevis]|nr:hypothetical protein XELAEV_18002837mg [Xenopus laevis]